LLRAAAALRLTRFPRGARRLPNRNRHRSRRHHPNNGPSTRATWPSDACQPDARYHDADKLTRVW